MIELNLVKFDNGLVPTNDTDKAILNQIQDGEFVNVKISTGKSRSLQQLNLYWAACKTVSDNLDDNNFRTPEIVSEQCKINLRLVDYWFTYLNHKTGQQTLNIKTKTISFSNCDTAEITKFINDSFEYMAKLLNTDVDSFIQDVKSEMVTQKITKTFNGSVLK